MNQTNASNTTSTVPSDYSYLTWDLILRLVVLAIGMLTNTINIAVFLNKKLKDESYKYMLSNSITNFLYLSVTFIGVFLYNCTYCPSSQTYGAVIYSIGIIFYFSSCLAIFRIVVEIALSVRTYLILTNKSFERFNYKNILAILLFISLLYYGQQPFAYGVGELSGPEDQVLYTAKANQFGNSPFAKTLIIVQFSVRIFLAVVVLSTVNCFSVIEFKKKLDARNNLMETNHILLSSSNFVTNCKYFNRLNSWGYFIL